MSTGRHGTNSWSSLLGAESHASTCYIPVLKYKLYYICTGSGSTIYRESIARALAYFNESSTHIQYSCCITFHYFNSWFYKLKICVVQCHWQRGIKWPNYIICYGRETVLWAYEFLRGGERWVGDNSWSFHLNGGSFYSGGREGLGTYLDNLPTFLSTSLKGKSSGKGSCSQRCKT